MENRDLSKCFKIRAEVGSRLVHECFVARHEIKEEITENNKVYGKYGDLYRIYVSALSKVGEKYSIEEQYAEFCILADRQGLKPLRYLDWLTNLPL